MTARFLAGLLLLASGVLRADEADRIDAAAFDAPRLARAVFAAANRVRAQAGLPAFRPAAALDQAAETQARIGAVFRPPSHTNPFPLVATPYDRVRQAGVDPRYVAENIALVPIYDAPVGAGFFRLRGERVVRLDRTGEPLRPHTYDGFAAAVVAAWMESPGHRAHLLDRKLRELGCSAVLTTSDSGIEMAFVVQVFCTPHPPGFRFVRR
jgi:uncharacterized protein YkwD